jgi:hypothetical protein
VKALLTCDRPVRIEKTTTVEHENLFKSERGPTCFHWVELIIAVDPKVRRAGMNRVNAVVLFKLDLVANPIRARPMFIPCSALG